MRNLSSLRVLTEIDSRRFHLANLDGATFFLSLLAIWFNRHGVRIAKRRKTSDGAFRFAEVPSAGIMRDLSSPRLITESDIPRFHLWTILTATPSTFPCASHG